jgi:transcriptional regulator with XRE-family HTH domain
MGARELGIYIRSIRDGMGFSRDEFKRLFNLSRSSFERIETGTQNVSALHLARIAERLSLRPDRLFALLRAQNMPDHEIEALAHKDLSVILSKKTSSELQAIREAANRLLDETTEEQ